MHGFWVAARNNTSELASLLYFPEKKEGDKSSQFTKGSQGNITVSSAHNTCLTQRTMARAYVLCVTSKSSKMTTGIRNAWNWLLFFLSYTRLTWISLLSHRFELESIILGHYDVLHTTTASMKKFFGKVYKNRVDILNRILKISIEQSMMPEARYHFLKFLCIILITKANDQIIVNEPKIW